MQATDLAASNRARVAAARSRRPPWLRAASYLAVLGAIVTAGGGVTACAHSMPSPVVIRVEHNAITKATVDHWVRVEAVLSQQLIPRRPVPRGLVPDPPRYIACVEYLRATNPAPGQDHGSGGTGLLKTQCRQRYEAVRRHVLALLITFQWLVGEGARRGVTVSSDEVSQQLAQFKRENFTSRSGFQNYLTYTGASLADELLVLKIDLLAVKLEQQIAAKGGPSAVATFSREFPNRWMAKTSCSRGYVVSDCRQYDGPLPPEAAT